MIESVGPERAAVSCSDWLDVRRGVIVIFFRVSLNECTSEREAEISRYPDAHKQKPSRVTSRVRCSGVQPVIRTQREAIVTPQIDGEDNNRDTGSAENDIDQKSCRAYLLTSEKHLTRIR